MEINDPIKSSAIKKSKKIKKKLATVKAIKKASICKDKAKKSVKKAKSACKKSDVENERKDCLALSENVTEEKKLAQDYSSNIKKTGKRKVQSSKEQIKTALIKRVKGYDAREEVIEKAYDEGEMRIVKQKTTLKHIPPDTAAIKLLLEMEGVLCGVENMSDDELLSMRDRLMLELKNNNICK